MPLVAPATTIVPPGRSEFPQVASPTVSMATSTFFGTLSPLSKASRAPRSRTTFFFSSLRLVAYTSAPAAAAREIAAVATPPPAPCTRTRSLALIRACVNSMR